MLRGPVLLLAPQTAQPQSAPKVSATPHRRFGSVDGRTFLMFGLLGHFRVGQSDVNAMLGDMSNLIGVDEPTAGVGIDRRPIKDVLLLDGQHFG